MIANLKSAKANLSELVARASGGEEVIITVRGKPTARLCAVGVPDRQAEVQEWGTMLEEARARYGGSGKGDGVNQQMWDELRGERL